MKLGFISAAAMLTLLPGAALADSATYTAVYSPVLDVTTRSCDITRTGVQGSNTLGESGITLNQISSSNNTSVMRTIGQDPGTAESKAGIQFDMVGANIVVISAASMTAERGIVNTGGSIKLNLPNARVKITKNAQNDLSLDEGNLVGGTVAEVKFQNGQLTDENSLDQQGSVVVGQRRGGNRAGGRSSLEDIQNDRTSGRRTGEVKFTMNNIDRDTPTTIMKATITCEPVPVARDNRGGLITAIRDENNNADQAPEEN